MTKLEKVSTHMNAKTHDGTVFMPRDLLSFDPKINGVSGLMVEHFYVSFGDPSCIDFFCR